MTEISITPGAPLPAEEQARVLDTTRRLGKARETLDTAAFVALLTDGAVYEAQDVLEPLVGKAQDAGHQESLGIQ